MGGSGVSVGRGTTVGSAVAVGGSGVSVGAGTGVGSAVAVGSVPTAGRAPGPKVYHSQIPAGMAITSSNRIRMAGQ